MRRKRKTENKKQMAVNVPSEIRRRIEKEADEENLSISAWIWRAIQHYLEMANNKREEKL